jgi:hypothetical protein
MFVARFSPQMNVLALLAPGDALNCIRIIQSFLSFDAKYNVSMCWSATFNYSLFQTSSMVFTTRA